MRLHARPVPTDVILPWRDRYRHEMQCQIIHDSLHSRPGWTQSYGLELEASPVGYGAVAVGGPWQGRPTAFEFYVEPRHRSRLFEAFTEFLAVAGAVAIETQSNDLTLTTLAHSFAASIRAESILFQDGLTTTLRCPEGLFRRARAEDLPGHFAQPPKADVEWVIEYAGHVAAVGGILYHYNRPYGDLYMEVAEPYRRRGFGSYLVQELKRVCYAQGSIPAARCNLNNIHSRQTLQKAGFIPCGNLLVAQVPPRLPAGHSAVANERCDRTLR